MDRKIWYSSASNTFQDALPLGNGSMGAIFHGTLPNEDITLNYDTFWSGTGRRTEKEIPKECLEHARQLIFEEEFFEAQNYIERHMLGQYNESYMPIGELHYKFTNLVHWNNYKRGIDLNTGIAFVEFEAEHTKYTIESFASFPDQTIVFLFSCDKKKKLDLEISLDAKVKYGTIYEKSGMMKMGGNAPSKVWPNYIPCDQPIIYEEHQPGMAFGCCCKINAKDGELQVKSDKLIVEHASEITIFITMDDGYKGFDKPFEKNKEVCIQNCVSQLERLNEKQLQNIQQDHIKDYQSIFHKMSFELEEHNPIDKPMDLRLEDFRKGKEDLQLETLFFDYDRYLMIASSRKGSQPANLQGIWNGSVRPVWSSNWTTNINTEMNYWLTCPCNLTQCYEPFISFLEDLSIAGRETATKQFHCNGWVANHNIDIWRHTEPVGGSAKYAYWPMAGVWLSSQVYDYYSYTLDKECLEHRIYPIMKGSVEFCLDWLVEGKDHLLHTAPSTSPENTFVDDKGRECGVSYSSTMDIAVMKELFERFMEAQQVLNRKDDLTVQVQEAWKRMPEYQINKAGKMQEWIKDFEEYDLGHRHFSPLFGLYPGTQFETEEQLEACKKLMESRTSNHHLQIGWSCAWLINLWAKMRDGEKALYYVESLLKHSVYPNLFDLHPPLGEGPGEREVFQIDGNFGSASGMVGMLLQSKKGKIELLPALPKKWSAGSVKGILAHGNIKVDIWWEHGKMKQACFESPYSQKVNVIDVTSKMTWALPLSAGEKMTIKRNEKRKNDR